VKRAFSFLDGIADRICAVLGAVGLSQFPQFFGQYMQRLGGHLSEARRIYEQYQQAAADAGLSLEEYIQEHLDATNDIFVSSGRVIENLVNRYHELEQSFLALADSNIYNRWFVFLKEVDPEIAAGTWESFVPGVPTTIEGLFYAVTGLLIGWGIYAGLKTIISYPFRQKSIKIKRAS
jgi:phage-related protein